MKLETNRTYLTPSGVQVRINHVQSIMFGAIKLFREQEGTAEYWHENGGHRSGNDALRLVMVMPEPIEVENDASAEPKIEPIAEPIPIGQTGVSIGQTAGFVSPIQLIEINWPARTVRVLPCGE